MRSRFPIAIAALTACAALATPAFGGSDTEIQVTDNKYTPKDATGRPDFDVHWFVSAPTDEHNVVSSNKLFDSGPLVDEVDFRIQPSAGTFKYYCETHGTKSGRGMAGTVAVAPVATGGTLSVPAMPRPLLVPWALQ